MPEEITLRPIGVVHSSVNQPQGAGFDWQKVISEITVDESLTEALDGLDEFSHIIVLYWMHREQRGTPTLKIHPRSDANLPLMGLFATRTPQRPNPIGKATVRLLERRQNVLTVKGLDALDGTPVIDIKPYIPGYDSADDAKGPPWSVRR